MQLQISFWYTVSFDLSIMRAMQECMETPSLTSLGTALQPVQDSESLPAAVAEGPTPDLDHEHVIGVQLRRSSSMAGPQADSGSAGAHLQEVCTFCSPPSLHTLPHQDESMRVADLDLYRQNHGRPHLLSEVYPPELCQGCTHSAPHVEQCSW